MRRFHFVSNNALADPCIPWCIPYILAYPIPRCIPYTPAYPCIPYTFALPILDLASPLGSLLLSTAPACIHICIREIILAWLRPRRRLRIQVFNWQRTTEIFSLDNLQTKKGLGKKIIFGAHNSKYNFHRMMRRKWYDSMASFIIVWQVLYIDRWQLLISKSLIWQLLSRIFLIWQLVLRKCLIWQLLINKSFHMAAFTGSDNVSYSPTLQKKTSER